MKLKSEPTRTPLNMIKLRLWLWCKARIKSFSTTYYDWSIFPKFVLTNLWWSPNLGEGYIVRSEAKSVDAFYVWRHHIILEDEVGRKVRTQNGSWLRFTRFWISHPMYMIKIVVLVFFFYVDCVFSSHRFIVLCDIFYTYIKKKPFSSGRKQNCDWVYLRPNIFYFPSILCHKQSLLVIHLRCFSFRIYTCFGS